MKLVDYGNRTLITSILGAKSGVTTFVGHVTEDMWPGDQYQTYYLFYLVNGSILDEFSYKVAYDNEKIVDRYAIMTYVKSTLKNVGAMSCQSLTYQERQDYICNVHPSQQHPFKLKRLLNWIK